MGFISKTAYLNIWPTNFFRWPPPPFLRPLALTCPSLPQGGDARTPPPERLAWTLSYKAARSATFRKHDLCARNHSVTRRVSAAVDQYVAEAPAIIAWRRHARQPKTATDSSRYSPPQTDQSTGRPTVSRLTHFFHEISRLWAPFPLVGARHSVTHSSIWRYGIRRTVEHVKMTAPRHGNVPQRSVESASLTISAAGRIHLLPPSECT